MSIGSKPTVDIYLIMDDIIEKLSLLDYENSFCKGWKHRRVSRIYFAHPPHMGEDQTARCNVLYDMCYWLMSMNKEKVSFILEGWQLASLFFQRQFAM